jgi:hypothetical protein
MKHFKSLLIIFLLFFFTDQAFGAAAACSTAGGGSGICYVDTASSGGDGTTTATSGAQAAFATLAAVAGKTYAAGDIIKLKRGCVWYETIAFPTSGSAGSPITITNYGDSTLDLPFISGEHSNPSTYSWEVHDAGTKVFKLNVGGTTDPGTLWRTTATGHTIKMQENTTSAASLMDLEWFYDSTAKYVYVRDLSGGAAPTDTIRIPWRNGITAATKTFLTLDGLKINFTGVAAVQYTGSSEGMIIQNCDLGYAAAYVVNMNTAAKNTYIRRNWIHDQDYAAVGAVNIVAGADAADLLWVGYNLFTGISGGLSLGSATAPGAVYVYNNTFRDFRSGFYSNTSTSANAVIDVRNNIFSSTGWGTAANINSTSAGPTHTFDYNIWLPNGSDITKLIDTDSPAGTHCLTDYAQHKYPIRYGYFSFTEDNIKDAAEEIAPMAYAKGIGMTFYLSGSEWNNNSEGVKASYTTLIQDFVSNKGCELGNHSLNHSTWGLMNGIAIQYVGAGTAVSMTIGSNTLTTTVDGSGDLNIDLTNASYDTMTELATYIDGLAGYTAAVKTSGTSSTANIISTVLKDASYADIKTSSVNVEMDTTRYVASEASGWNTTMAGLFSITPANLAYPDTSPAATAAVVTSLAASGVFESARTAAIGNLVLSSGIDLFALDCTTGFSGEVAYFAFDDAVTSKVNTQTLTASSTGYSTDRPYGAKSLEFTRASSSYAYRAVSTYWDKSGRDWLMTMYYKPKDLTAKQTLFSHYTDASNFCEIYLDTDGYVHFDVKTGGSYVLQMTASSTPLSTSYWYRITVYQAYGRFRIYVTQRTDAYTFAAPVKVAEVLNSTVTIPAYTGDVQVGRFYDGTTADYYCNGYMDVLGVEQNGWRNSMAMWNFVADVGAFRTSLSHGESSLSRGYYIRAFDALTEFNGGANSSTSGKIRPVTVHTAVAAIKAAGRTATDVRAGANLYRMDIPRNTYYEDLNIDSPTIYGGADLSITGGDRAGIPLRNSAAPTIGSKEKYPKVF